MEVWNKMLEREFDSDVKGEEDGIMVCKNVKEYDRDIVVEICDERGEEGVDKVKGMIKDIKDEGYKNDRVERRERRG